MPRRGRWVGELGGWITIWLVHLVWHSAVFSTYFLSLIWATLHRCAPGPWVSYRLILGVAIVRRLCCIDFSISVRKNQVICYWAYCLNVVPLHFFFPFCNDSSFWLTQQTLSMMTMALEVPLPLKNHSYMLHTWHRHNRCAQLNYPDSRGLRNLPTVTHTVRDRSPKEPRSSKF